MIINLDEDTSSEDDGVYAFSKTILFVLLFYNLRFC